MGNVLDGCTNGQHRYKLCIVLRLPVELAPHGNIPHRYHLLLTALAAAILVPTRHRRHIRIHPRLVSLLAPVDIARLTAAGGAPAAIVTADQSARSMRVAGFLHVAESLGADFVGFAAAGEAGAEAGGEESAEDGSEHGEAGGEDADVAFDV